MVIGAQAIAGKDLDGERLPQFGVFDGAPTLFRS